MRAVLVSLVLVAIAIGISIRARLGVEKDLIVATIRALIQLAIVAAVIDFVFDRLGLSGLVLIVMLGAAAWTSARRMKGVPSALLLAAAAIGMSAGLGLVILFGARAFEFEPQYLIPIGGMLIGNCMTAVSVTGARLRDELIDKSLEVEARLALGVSAKDALRPYTRRSATSGLIPVIDSTKNSGLIFLPGAFVGMIIGGAPPREAAEVQLVVLFMLLGAVATAGMVTTYLVARRFVGEGERLVLPVPENEA